MVLEDFAVARQVILFQGGRGEGSFGVKKPRKLSDESITLSPCQLGVFEVTVKMVARTLSRRSFNCDSSRCSSSVGFGGGLAREANCA